jgi:hypothetical protein
MAQVITIVVCLPPEIFLVLGEHNLQSMPRRHSLDTKDSSGVVVVSKILAFHWDSLRPKDSL